jgi:hypothetical protein
LNLHSNRRQTGDSRNERWRKKKRRNELLVGLFMLGKRFNGKINNITNTTLELLRVIKANHGRYWVLVLVCGLIGFVLGISLLVYALVVVAHGPFPALFSDFETPGMFLLGYGIGCTSVTPIVRQLEQRP